MNKAESSETAINCSYVTKEIIRTIKEQEGKKVFEYDIFECPTELKGQLTIGEWVK